MRLAGSVLPTAGLAVCLPGCAEVSLRVVRSNRAPTPIDHLFVTVAQGPFDQSYAEEMSDALVTALCGHVDVRRGPVLTGLELDDRVMSERLRAAGADGLLLLNPIGGAVGGYRHR